MATRFPGWRNMTGVERRNARMFAIFEDAKALAISKGRCPDCWADISACAKCERAAQQRNAELADAELASAYGWRNEGGQWMRRAKDGEPADFGDYIVAATAGDACDRDRLI